MSLVAPVELPEVTVEFGASAYAVAEGGTQSVTVTLSADPERTVVIPLTRTEQGGATSLDYSGVPASVTFNTGETSKTFTFNATDDSVDDDGESVKLGLGALPSRVTKGTTKESVVSITDDDKPTSLTVKFEQSTYRVGEGSSVAVKLTLSDDPEQDILIPIITTNQGGATSADYEPIPTAVTFRAGETSTSIGVTAVDDTVDDDTESVRLSFGTLPTTPATVTQVSPSETVVSITDDDVPEVTVNFQSAALTVAEGNSATVRVTLSADPERTVTVPISRSNENGASDQDYSGVPASVRFTSGNTSATFTVSMTQDTIDDDGENVKLGFGAMPTRVSQGATNELAINITDDDDPQVSVSFEQAQYSVDEGQDIAIKVVLSADPGTQRHDPNQQGQPERGIQRRLQRTRQRHLRLGRYRKDDHLHPPPKTPSTTTGRTSGSDSAACRPGWPPGPPARPRSASPTTTTPRWRCPSERTRTRWLRARRGPSASH